MGVALPLPFLDMEGVKIGCPHIGCISFKIFSWGRGGLLQSGLDMPILSLSLDICHRGYRTLSGRYPQLLQVHGFCL